MTAFRLWIDDVREPPDESWAWVKTSKAAVDVLKHMCGLPSLITISFDHDLGGDDTTMIVAQWIEEMAAEGAQPPTWAIHSANPVGRKNLEAALRSAEKLYRAHREAQERRWDDD